MPELLPWKCPWCNLVLAPAVMEHRCPPDDGAGVTVVTNDPPGGGSGSISISPMTTTTPALSIWSGTITAAGGGASSFSTSHEATGGATVTYGAFGNVA